MRVDPYILLLPEYFYIDNIDWHLLNPHLDLKQQAVASRSNLTSIEYLTYAEYMNKI